MVRTRRVPQRGQSNCQTAALQWPCRSRCASRPLPRWAYRRAMFYSRLTASLNVILLTCSPYAPSTQAQNPSVPDPSSGCTLRIHVDGLRNSNGVVGSTIFKAPDGWPEDNSKSFRHGPTPIAPGERQATMRSLRFTTKTATPGSTGTSSESQKKGLDSPTTHTWGYRRRHLRLHWCMCNAR